MALRRKHHPHVVGDGVLDLADAMHLDREPDECVVVYPKYKAPGKGFRPICQFGQVNRARQSMLRKLLTATVDLDARQFAVTAGGRQVACARVLDRLRNGYTFAMEVDIKDFFPSISREWLCQNLGIDRKMAEGVILSQQATFRPGDRVEYRLSVCTGSTSLLESARRGLTQGASHSPIVAEMVVGKVMATVPSGTEVINYADNFLLLGRTKREVEEALETLKAAVRQCPAGCFELKAKTARRCADGFDFLGYRFRKSRHRASADPTNQSIGKFVLRVYNEVDRLCSGRTKPNKLYLRVCSWWGAYKHSRALGFCIYKRLCDQAKRRPEVAVDLTAMANIILRKERALFEEAAQALSGS